MDNTDEKESGMKWLLPLIILILLVFIGYWFCSKTREPAKTEALPANTNTANTNK